jgi:hypothetical protein
MDGMTGGAVDLNDMDADALEALRQQIEAEQIRRSATKAVALELKRTVEDLAAQNPKVFAEAFTSQGVEGCAQCVHVPIGEPDPEHDPHLQYGDDWTADADPGDAKH